MFALEAFASDADARDAVFRGAFFSGTAANPIYVDRIIADQHDHRRLPVVHGGCHTGLCYLSTPDGRRGWADYFARAGHEVYVVDWPSHGRSPQSKHLAALSTQEIAESLLALVAAVGRTILLVHSASGPMAWWICERAPDLVAAIIAIAPGAPANILPHLPDDPDVIASLSHDACWAKRHDECSILERPCR
jgi:pimeloyl-ACP methyl ester carboxylesterase